MVSEEGISTDPDKVQTIFDSQPPKDVIELRSVMGFFSYYRKFIPHFSDLAKPMIKLTEKDRQFQWKEEQQKAFQDLKENLS